jgi:hypothetical protein
MNQIVLIGLFCIACVGICMMPVSSADVSADAFLTFEEFPAGTYISEQYASDHLHFMSDSANGGTYRAAPRIMKYPYAKSPTNVIVNGYSGWELSNSEHVSLMLWFDKPVAGVGMWLGTVPDVGAGGVCSGPINATVSAYSCDGILRGEKEVQVSSAFDTPVEIDDETNGFSIVVIDYGESLCPEAIDDLAFNYATGPAAVCSSPSGLMVWISSPASSGERKTVNEKNQTIRGIVGTDGIFKSVQVDGVQAQFYLNSSPPGGLYPFWYDYTAQITLEEGMNLVTAYAENLYGYTGNSHIILDVGTPQTAELNEFHLTQRGVMQNTPCDIDGPLVAGKSAIIRIDMDVRTDSGIRTYASQVEMTIWRQDVTGQDLKVGTVWGWLYSPFVSGFNSPTDMASIHFWVPGEMLSPAGAYRFTFQPYAGLNPIGEPISPDCGDEYYIFDNTRSIEALVLPVEAGLYSPRLMNTNHAEYSLRQINALVRTFPIRDSGTGGFYFYELNPFPLCDGTMATVTSNPDYCKGTGFEWTFIDRHPSAILTRADAVPVTNASVNACGNPDDHQIGGVVQSDANFTYAFDPLLGIYRAGAHPCWGGAKYAIPLDSDHDGTIDSGDLSHYIAEFFDDETNAWKSDLSLYDQGETFRFFRDADGDFCNDPDDETQADIRLLWENQQNILFGPVAHARDAFCTDGICTNDFPLGTFWFPDELVASDSRFGDIGPGQGVCGNGKGGVYSWIRMRNASALPHELGHNVGGLFELYTSTAGTCKRADPDDDDMDTKEGAWAVYIDTESVPPAEVFAVMGLDAPPDRVVHYLPDYQDLYDTLSIPPSQVQTYSVKADTDRFVVSGWIHTNTKENDLHCDVMSGLSGTEEDITSPYALVFGRDTTELGSFRFPVENQLSNVEGSPDFPVTRIPVHIIASLPAGTEWVEVRDTGTVLATFTKSANAPIITVTSPSNGDAFTATERTVIRWESSDPDGDRLSHTIYYSPDGGDEWRVVGTRVGGTEYGWDLSTAPGTDGNGIVRVIASDGFNTAEDQSDGRFTIEGKPPIAIIVEPHDGRTVLECSRVMLRGFAYDPEGTTLQYAWYVDDSPAGTGERVEIDPLAPGVHEVRMQVSDPQENTITRQVAITVLADSDCDGMSDDYEETFGLHPGYTADAALDNDGDGLINFNEAGYGTNPHSADTDGDGVNDADEIAAGTDPLGDTSQPPVADAGGPYLTTEGTLIELDASGSFDPDGNDLAFRWDFCGNGVWDMAWSFDPVTPMLWCDNFAGTVTVQVRDGTGLTSMASTTVNVDNVAPIASIDAVHQPNSQFILPLVHTIGFNGSVTDPGCDSWTYAWDFDGDGTIDSSEINATHIYGEPGTYMAQFTVTDDDGGEGSASFQFIVSTPAEAKEDLAAYIQALPEGAFKGNAEQRKDAYAKMFAALDEMIEDEEWNGFIHALDNNIREKADGLIDGKANDDWITDQTAQKHITMKIDDIIAYVKMIMEPEPE